MRCKYLFNSIRFSILTWYFCLFKRSPFSLLLLVVFPGSVYPARGFSLWYIWKIRIKVKETPVSPTVTCHRRVFYFLPHHKRPSNSSSGTVNSQFPVCMMWDDEFEIFVIKTAHRAMLSPQKNNNNNKNSTENDCKYYWVVCFGLVLIFRLSSFCFHKVELEKFLSVFRPPPQNEYTSCQQSMCFILTKQQIDRKACVSRQH